MIANQGSFLSVQESRLLICKVIEKYEQYYIIERIKMLWVCYMANQGK